jgi:hypothetical protein
MRILMFGYHADEHKLITQQQLDKLREMWENGCPTYDPDGYDAHYCWFCNILKEGMTREYAHRDDCPWLTLEELFEP